MHLALLIPAYQPDKTLYVTVQNIKAIFNDTQQVKDAKLSVMIVNDASTHEISSQTFELIRSTQKFVTIINREKNGGQGAALKTGFLEILENLKDVDFVVTADADGQHLPEDIISIFKEGIETNFEMPILGVREFGKNVPARSRIGNILTSYVVKFLYGYAIEDTQTGLRGFPKSYLNTLVLKKSDRFNFNSEVLVHLMINGGFVQKKITTVYEPGNPSSHFRPFVDSIQIYSIFFRYSAVMLSVFLLELFNFSILYFFTQQSLPSFALAKIISIIVSFIFLKEKVFLSNSSYNWKSVLGYVFLSISHLFFVWWIFETLQKNTNLLDISSAVISYSIMFLVVYWIQRNIIFKKNR